MKDYTSEEIIERAKLVTNYKRTEGIPLLVAVRSNADVPDIFDDKVVLLGELDSVLVRTSATTNAGAKGLLNGWTAVLKANEFYPKGYAYGMHKGKMPALRQQYGFKYYRDTDKDNKSEPIGEVYEDLIYTNFHGVSYKPDSQTVLANIGLWSVGCIVANRMVLYGKIIRYCKRFSRVDFVLLQEW